MPCCHLLELAGGRGSLLWVEDRASPSLMHVLQNILRDIIAKDGASIFLRPDMVSGKFLNPPDGQTLLHLVAKHYVFMDGIGRSTFMSHLLRAKADPFQADSKGCSPLCIALDRGSSLSHSLRSFLFLTYKNAKVDRDGYISESEPFPESALPVQVDLSPDKCPIPHMVLAAMRSMFEEGCYDVGISTSIHYLLKAGASVDDADETGMTPLMYAVGTGSIEIVKMLLFHGADPEKPNPHSSLLPIHEAARCGFADIIRALVYGVAECERKAYDRGRPRLRTNARPILGTHVQLEAVDSNSRTAIWHAASQGWVETLRFLLISQYNGSSLSSRVSGAFREMRDQADSDGVTALQAAKLRVESGFVSHSAAECVWMLERDAALLSWGWDSWDKVGGIGLFSWQFC